jgi:hypothetical protein
MLAKPLDGRRTVLLAFAFALVLAGAASAGAREESAAQASSALTRVATHSFDRGLFVSSPDGIMATAARVVELRPLIVAASQGSGVDPDLLEAMVVVESSGRPDAVVDDVAGLTQLSVPTAQEQHLRVEAAKSRRLTRRIEAAEAGGRVHRAEQLRGWRARYDERFDPGKALAATVRCLVDARRRLGRTDLAVEAYHLGTGNLENAIAAYGGDAAPSYAQLYFGSAPDRHRDTWLGLQYGGEYYWQVLAAERVMRLYRDDPAVLVRESLLQARKLSSEEVLHPLARTTRFATPAAVARAWRLHILRAIPRDTAVTHVRVSRGVGAEARVLGRSRRLYAALRPTALDVLLYVGARVHQLSGARSLVLTSAVRDNRYQRVLKRVNPNAARSYSMHTTGYAFDIARSYSSGRQAESFQFVLDRLSAVGAIAYIREPAVIHVAVASDALQKIALLGRVG